jgi:hypothetical protein
MSRLVLGPTQPPIQWVMGLLFLGVMQSVREAEHSPRSSAEVKECVELCLYCSSMSSWRDAQLKHRDNFILPEVFQSNTCSLLILCWCEKRSSTNPVTNHVNRFSASSVQSILTQSGAWSVGHYYYYYFVHFVLRIWCWWPYWLSVEWDINWWN